MKSTTCIVGWKVTEGDRTTIYMGSDGQVSQGSEMSKGHGYNKIFTNGDFLMGVTGCVYASNLLKHVWTPPDRAEKDTDTNYLYKKVVPDLRRLFKDHGHTTTVDGLDRIHENVMLAYNRELYVLHIDFCLIESLRPFEAVGCGRPYALGACYVLQEENMPMDQKIRKAILAADEFSMGVDSNIYIQTKVWEGRDGLRA